MDWRTAEIYGYTFYSLRGWDILIRLVEGSVYDFVIAKDGVYKTVNVKVAKFFDKRGYQFSFSGASRGKKKPKRADIYLAWLPGEEMFVPVPGKSLGGPRSNSYRISFQQIRAAKERQRAFRLRQQQKRD